ncbi:ThuA domain-containing protein [Dyadobacter sandarakinus]|uniref:ThuA domain-containing protein n=1 Tax=Dyadobacter sandarakinus TaxID=2747268 RepID=A0ABX7I7P2_9BACT|nr:ThuA domain-containing protein [Dyadobacter sandarakinus]QRR02116.1 ThuA domain-containing protein [Dyadobacter sandarakinus]
MKHSVKLILAFGVLLLSWTSKADDHSRYRVVYKGDKGPGVGKNIVFIATDHEYRSEESLPALARIMAKRYGFTCTVVYALDDEGYILPGSSNLKGLDILKKADLLVMFMRFAHPEDQEMQHIDDYVKRGGPIVAFRTSTHAFEIKNDPKWEHYTWDYKGPKTAWKDGFGEYVLGETWVSHYGTNHKQSSKLVIEPAQANNPVMTGAKDIWVQSGGYTAEPKGTVIARGQVLNGMTSDSKPDPTKELLPVAWTREYRIEGGKPGRAFVTTHGAAEDLLNDGFRRMALNAMFWGMGMEKNIKADNDIAFVGPYKPTTFNFSGYKAHVKPSDLAGWDSVIMPGEVVKKKAE